MADDRALHAAQNGVDEIGSASGAMSMLMGAEILLATTVVQGGWDFNIAVPPARRRVTRTAR